MTASAEKIAKEINERIDMQRRVISWFGAGDTGLSSETIAIAGSGGDKPKRGWDWPRDPSDFGRCARLLALIPELRDPAFARLSEDGGEKWRSIISRWDDVHTCMDREVGIDWSKGKRAEATYHLMKSLGL